MKHLKKSLLLSASVVLLVAATTGQKTEKKGVNFDLTIRYVDSFAAIRESDEGKSVAKELEAKRAELTKDIKEMEKKFAAAAKEFQTKATMMSELAREKEQKQLVKMEREYKAKLQESDEDMKITMQSAQERLLREHHNSVFKYAKKNDVDLVIGPGGVVFASEKASCTLDVIEGMNKNYQVKLAKAQGKKSETVVAAGSSKKKSA